MYVSIAFTFKIITIKINHSRRRIERYSSAWTRLVIYHNTKLIWWQQLMYNKHPNIALQHVARDEIIYIIMISNHDGIVTRQPLQLLLYGECNLSIRWFAFCFFFTLIKKLYFRNQTFTDRKSPRAQSNVVGAAMMSASSTHFAKKAFFYSFGHF